MSSKTLDDLFEEGQESIRLNDEEFSKLKSILDRENQKIDDSFRKRTIDKLLPQVKEEALRYDDNKMRFDLLPVEGIIELTRVYTIGAIKYKDNNWRKGMKFSKCVASLERHWIKWKLGEQVDPETGCHHLAHVCWNAMTLLVYCLTKTGTDDRNMNYKIDDSFNIVDNHLGIGLSEEKIQELRNKFPKEKD